MTKDPNEIEINPFFKVITKTRHLPMEQREKLATLGMQIGIHEKVIGPNGKVVEVKYTVVVTEIHPLFSVLVSFDAPAWLLGETMYDDEDTDLDSVRLPIKGLIQ